jgi:hypothetical protein
MSYWRVRASGFCVALTLLLPDAALLAKTTAVTLSELVQESSVIVYGQIDRGASLPPGSASSWVPFNASRIVKGDSSLDKEPMFLCNLPPAMREYPDVSKLTGKLVLFLSAKKNSCFDFSHTVKSVVEVHADQAETIVINDQPETQSLELFLRKLRKLVSTAALGRPRSPQ